MIECTCTCDCDSDGKFDRGPATIGEYHTCTECGDTIWPWQSHEVGWWWSCEACNDFDEDVCSDEDCGLDKAPTSESHMCSSCGNVCRQLLCDCWYVGMVWEQIADQNEMSVVECIGGDNG